MFGQKQKHVFVIDEGFQYLTDSQEVMKQSECRVSCLPDSKHICTHRYECIYISFCSSDILIFKKTKPTKKHQNRTILRETRVTERYITADYMRRDQL